MPDLGRVLYADTSALLKLVVHEAESDAVERELPRWTGVATSSITAIELRRAVARAREDERESVAGDETVEGVLAASAEIPLSARIRETASRLPPTALRTLDAIHLAAALALGSDLGAILTYDARLAEAARMPHIEVISPE